MKLLFAPVKQYEQKQKNSVTAYIKVYGIKNNKQTFYVYRSMYIIVVGEYLFPSNEIIDNFLTKIKRSYVAKNENIFSLYY